MIVNYFFTIGLREGTAMKLAKFLSIVLATGLFLTFSCAFAQNETTKTKTAENKAQAAQKKTDMTSAENLKIQRFILDATEQLGVEFRYVNDNLKYIYFWNTGKPLELDIFENKHVLGTNNDLSIRSPNLKRIVLHVYPYTQTVSPTSSARLLSKTYVFSEDEEGLYELNSKHFPN